MKGKKMHNFKVGDRVEAIDDIVKGSVIEINASQITIETDDGFPLTFDPSALIKISEKSGLEVSDYEVARIKQEKELPVKPRKKAVRPKERNAPKMEVDLHIHQLIASTRNMSKYDILNLQLETAKRQLEFAIRKRIQKIVFIHGVGEGILKEELTYLFGRYEQVTHYDADYQKYGLGATEVYIYQNP